MSGYRFKLPAITEIIIINFLVELHNINFKVIKGKILYMFKNLI